MLINAQPPLPLNKYKQNVSRSGLQLAPGHGPVHQMAPTHKKPMIELKEHMLASVARPTHASPEQSLLKDGNRLLIT